MVTTVPPFKTYRSNKVLPILKVPLFINFLLVPLAEARRGIWDVLKHFELEFDTIILVHLHSGELDDQHACSPNRCIFFSDLMLMFQVDIWMPNEL